MLTQSTNTWAHWGEQTEVWNTWQTVYKIICRKPSPTRFSNHYSQLDRRSLNGALHAKMFTFRLLVLCQWDITVDEVLAAVCLIRVLAQGEDVPVINLISSKIGTRGMEIWQIVISYSNKAGVGPKMKLHYFYLPHLSAKNQWRFLCGENSQPDMNIYTLHGAPFSVMATSHLETLGARGDMLFIRG